MGLHAYCVVHATSPAPAVAGIGGTPVIVLDAGALALWCTVHDAPPGPGIGAIRAHNAVIAAAMDIRHTPVPLRFGQWFIDADAARCLILRDAARWNRMLERFAGKAEYGIRVDDGAGAAARDMRPARTGSGTAYMEALARRHGEQAERRRLAASAAARIGAATAGTVSDTRVIETPPAGTTPRAHLVAVAHLVDRARERDYLEAVGAARRSLQELTVHHGGPWPPYSFVE